MTDKSISGYQAGEFLQFQRDVLPENTSSYAIGTRTAPFYAIHAQRIPLTHIQQLTLSDYAQPYARGFIIFDAPNNRLVVYRSTTQRAGAAFSTF